MKIITGAAARSRFILKRQNKPAGGVSKRVKPLEIPDMENIRLHETAGGRKRGGNP